MIDYYNDSPNPTSGIYLKSLKAEFQRAICTPMFHCSIIHNSQNIKCKPNVHQWVSKQM